MLEVDAEMYELIESMQCIHVSQSKSHANGMYTLKTESRKRKRPVESAPYSIQTKIVAKNDFKSRVNEPFSLSMKKLRI